MPGICGFYNTGSCDGAALLLNGMLERLRTAACTQIRHRVDQAGRFGLGHASLGVFPVPWQPASIDEGRFLAAVDGEFETETLALEIRSKGWRLNQDDAETLLLANYALGGIDAVSELDGSFAAAIFNTVEQSLSIISDPFGTRPVYYAHSPERFSFASSIFSLLADNDIPRDFDWQGVSQFFTFGHFLGEHTSLRDVKILPAGTVLLFDARSNRISLHRYWHGDQRIGSRPASRRDAYAGIEDAMVRSVRRQPSCVGSRLGLSLSGGLDARTILGTLDQSQLDLTTVCMGMRGSKDHKTSTELAQIVGCRHHNHILDTAFLTEFGRHLEDMVRLTDGQYLSQCIIMPTLPLYQQLGVELLLRGHGGELMHMSKAYNYSLNAEALGVRTEDGLENWLWKRLPAYLQEGVEGPLFANRELCGHQIARESLREALAETPQSESPAQRIVHLFLDQRVRRETMLSMMKFRSVVEPRLPYLNRLLVARLLAVPVEWKLDDEIQMYVLRKHQPKFCAVENTNTGAPLGAGSLRRSYARLRMQVFGKLRMPGYQPYERLGSWLRRDLAELVQKTLLSSSCLSRGIFCPDTVRQVVRRHIAGQRNHTYLIMALMIFEVGQRWLLEGESLHDYRLSHSATAV